jgi:hypothetical protein
VSTVQTIVERVEQFRNGVENMMVEYYTKHFPTLPMPAVSIDWGKRYARIVKDDGNQRSVHCFVDLTNGDVLKAAGWKAPAKHARGSVLAEDYGISAVSVYGAHYLK